MKVVLSYGPIKQIGECFKRKLSDFSYFWWHFLCKNQFILYGSISLSFCIQNEFFVSILNYSVIFLDTFYMAIKTSYAVPTKHTTQLLWWKHEWLWPHLFILRKWPLPTTSWLLPASSDLKVLLVIKYRLLSIILKYDKNVCLRHDEIRYVFWWKRFR